MIKKFGMFCMLLAFLSIGLAASADMTLKYDGEYHQYNGSVFSLVVNDKKLENLPVPPIIFNDRALVPIREIFEELGANVSYDISERRVEVVYGNTYIRMYINDNAAYVNGKKTAIPDKVVPKLISIGDGETKTMVPVRFISETVGINIDFSSELEAILVNSGKYQLEPSTPSPTEKPEISPEITHVSYSMTGSNAIELLIETNTSIKEHSTFKMSSPERVVTDLAGFKVGDVEDIYINASALTAIRLGENEERARVVIDINGTAADYYASQLSDTMLSVTVTVSTASAPPAVTATPAVKVPSVTASPTPVPTKRPVSPSSDKLIVIDSGHGGKDSGAVGTLDDKQILEKDLTLQIAKKVRDILKSKGYTVDMTRTTDKYLELTEPPAQANEQNAAVFVSIHINSAEAKEAEGTEVYYSVQNNGDSYGTSSSVLAKNILSRMLYYMKSKNRGVKTANHAVTRRCNMPAVLVEVGFISNEEELKKMCSEDYQYKAAQGIAEGIINTLADIEIPEKEDNK